MPHEVEDAVGAVADEFMATGLDDQDEPNERGHLLEMYIDVLCRWHPDYAD